MKKYNEVFEEIYIRTLFSRNLRRLRDGAKMSQMNLAEKAGLAHNFINDIENGKKWVSPKTLAKLSIALKVEPSQLFLSDAKYNNQGAEMFSLYLADFTDSFDRMTKEYRKRFLGEDDESKMPDDDDEDEPDLHREKTEPDPDKQDLNSEKSD